MKIALLLTGTELLDGRIRDENGIVLQKALRTLGLRLNTLVFCGDSAAEIRQALGTLVGENAIIVCSGGLGPTAADQTRDAFGLPLEYDAPSEAKLRTLLASRNRPWHESLGKQCMLPKGATRFDNPVGSADPFVVPMDGSLVIAVPGVPREFNAIIDTLILPTIIQRARARDIPLLPQHEATFRLFGRTESEAAGYIRHAALTHGIETLIRADYPEIQIMIRGSGGADGFLLEKKKLADALPHDCVYSHALDVSLPAVVVALLLDQSRTIALAESCTGGLLSSLLTKIPGVSKVFPGAITAYENRIKEELLNVHPETLRKFGAVSRECASEMAASVRTLFSSDIGVSVTGIAGPDGGTTDKPVGTVYLGIAQPSGVRTFHLRLFDDRERIQIYSAHAALDEVRRTLLDLPARLS